MQIHEITLDLTEGIMDTVKGLGATALTKAFRPGYVRDPATGRLVPGKITQAAFDYEVNRNVSKWANKAIKDFYTYVKQTFNNNEPTPDEFRAILEKWAGAYLPPSNWKWPDSYSAERQKEIVGALDWAGHQYQLKPDGTKLKTVYNDVMKLITDWLTQTREQEKEYSEKKYYQAPDDPYVQFGQKLRSSFDLRSVGARRDIHTTGDSDVDSFLRGLGFKLDLRDYGSIAPQKFGILDKIRNSSEFRSWYPDIKSRLSNIAELKSTGDSVVDDFFRALGIRIV